MKKVNLLIATVAAGLIVSCSSGNTDHNSLNEKTATKSNENMETTNSSDTEIKNYLTGKIFLIAEGQSMAPFNSLSFSAEGMCTYGKTTEKFDIKDNVLLIGTGGLTLKYDFVKVDDSSFKIKVGQEKKEFVYTLSK